MKKNHLILCALAGTLVLGIWATSSAQPQLPAQRRPSQQLPSDIAEATKVEEEDVAKVLNALGPAIQKQLAQGKQVALPNLGVFRVVQIPAHRELRGGTPVLIPSENYVEFLPDTSVVQQVNKGGTKPAVVVPGFQYNPLPDQFQAPKSPRIRVPSTRIR